MADPRSITDHDFPLGLYLTRDRGGDIFVTMVLVSDVNVMPSPHIVTNHNSKMTHDPAPPPNQTTIANTHNRIGNALLARQHACTKRYAGPNHGVVTYVDVVLVVNRVGRETNDASVPESAELLTLVGGRSNSAV